MFEFYSVFSQFCDFALLVKVLQHAKMSVSTEYSTHQFFVWPSGGIPIEIFGLNFPNFYTGTFLAHLWGAYAYAYRCECSSCSWITSMPPRYWWRPLH